MILPWEIEMAINCAVKVHRIKWMFIQVTRHPMYHKLLDICDNSKVCN